MSKGKILVIDDEDIVLRCCQRILTPEGYDVDISKNGMEGLKLLKDKAFDLVLVDIKMPEMDGMEVLKQIKKKWSDTQVIIITGYSTLESAIFAMKLGAYDYVEKPFTPDGLTSAVKKAFDEEMGEQKEK